ncbi:DNA polymerase II large subunit [Candidatus Woesearchaeota archaeon]|nr:DNA polymerase II large subunit [Candidatus Woesearchaeota archaeon]
MPPIASPTIQKYFESIQRGIQDCYEVAGQARQKGLDPETTVPIPLAKNMAERVVGLISVVYPPITDTTVTQRIAELEKEYGLLDWRVAFKIAEEVAKEKFCSFETKQQAMEIGIRVGFAYLTLGIVSAPLEGFIGVKIKQRRDGKEYFALQYAGPIRGAGGTAASTSVILSDYVRVKMGYSTYDPDEKELSRYAAEIQDYHERVTNLQYRPSDEEIKFMVSHIPVEVDGDPTEKIEVSNYKDLPRIDTNMIRGGMALVLAEGLCQKAPKLWKRLSKWGKQFDLDWSFLEEFLALKEKIHAAHAAPKKEEGAETSTEVKVKPNNTFIMDLVAGRPIITHPLATGGLRLRYGRNRTSGFSATALHPATLIVLDKFIAIGTQLKMERPGKAATVTVCDTLEGPIVRLKDGSVVHFTSEEQARLQHKDTQEILFLGDVLFNYGDFSENGHRLVPPGYCPEWWALELEKSLQNRDSMPYLEMGIPKERVDKFIADPLRLLPDIDEAITLSTYCKVALHPTYSFFWKLVSSDDVLALAEWFALGKIRKDDKGLRKIILPYFSTEVVHLRGKEVLENIGVPHLVVSKESVVIERPHSDALAAVLGCADQKTLENLVEVIRALREKHQTKNGLELINVLSPFVVRDKAGTFIGARMGRPEKAKMRHLTGSPQALFPVGEEGGRLRSFQSALEAGKVTSTFCSFKCDACNSNTIYSRCDKCGALARQLYSCRTCGDVEKDVCRHGPTQPFKNIEIDIKHYLTSAKKFVNEDVTPELIKGIRGTSNKTHITEHLAKGILRAKHGIYVNKEGTTRYDCTELPLTHFKPKEIGAPIAKLRSIGYELDIHGVELTHDDQILEIKPQDVIIPGFDSLEESAPKVMLRVTAFIDDLLVRFYGLAPFYNAKKKEDLIGHLVIGLAPHISAGLVGRIIGFSETQGLITHPMYHAGLRRDCDGDEAAILMLMDGLLNFSRHFLPTTRGSTMDAPLVLTSFLDPTEVDDQVHGIDIMWKYPLEFYEAACAMKNAWEVKYGPDQKKIEQISDRLGKPNQYEGFGFTHHVDNFNRGVQCSAYKTLPSMEEKLVGQMEIARKVRAVNMDDVAKLVIQKHFLKDIKGNLRKFSMQQFRCVSCNEKYRRPPLASKCLECGGRLIFTISEGSVVKYLGPSLMLCEKYDFSPYLKQVLDILRTDVENIFGKEKEKQVGLGSFMT